MARLGTSSTPPPPPPAPSLGLAISMFCNREYGGLGLPHTDLANPSLHAGESTPRAGAAPGWRGPSHRACTLTCSRQQGQQ